jgi:hypothetical protein
MGPPAAKRQRIVESVQDDPNILYHGFYGAIDTRERPELEEYDDEDDDWIVDGSEEEEGDVALADLGDDEDLHTQRQQLDNALKNTFEEIIRKYERNFDGIGDEIDLRTGEIVVDNGHLRGLRNETDPGIGQGGRVTEMVEDEEVDDSLWRSENDDEPIDGREVLRALTEPPEFGDLEESDSGDDILYQSSGVVTAQPPVRPIPAYRRPFMPYATPQPEMAPPPRPTPATHRLPAARQFSQPAFARSTPYAQLPTPSRLHEQRASNDAPTPRAMPPLMPPPQSSVNRSETPSSFIWAAPPIPKATSLWDAPPLPVDEAYYQPPSGPARPILKSVLREQGVPKPKPKAALQRSPTSKSLWAPETARPRKPRAARGSGVMAQVQSMDHVVTGDDEVKTIVRDRTITSREVITTSTVRRPSQSMPQPQLHTPSLPQPLPSTPHHQRHDLPIRLSPFPQTTEKTTSTKLGNHGTSSRSVLSGVAAEDDSHIIVHDDADAEVYTSDAPAQRKRKRRSRNDTPQSGAEAPRQSGFGHGRGKPYSAEDTALVTDWARSILLETNYAMWTRSHWNHLAQLNPSHSGLSWRSHYRKKFLKNGSRHLFDVPPEFEWRVQEGTTNKEKKRHFNSDHIVDRRTDLSRFRREVDAEPELEVREAERYERQKARQRGRSARKNAEEKQKEGEAERVQREADMGQQAGVSEDVSAGSIENSVRRGAEMVQRARSNEGVAKEEGEENEKEIEKPREEANMGQHAMAHEDVGASYGQQMELEVGLLAGVNEDVNAAYVEGGEQREVETGQQAESTETLHSGYVEDSEAVSDVDQIDHTSPVGRPDENGEMDGSQAAVTSSPAPIRPERNKLGSSQRTPAGSQADVTCSPAPSRSVRKMFGSPQRTPAGSQTGITSSPAPSRSAGKMFSHRTPAGSQTGDISSPAPAGSARKMFCLTPARRRD